MLVAAWLALPTTDQCRCRTYLQTATPCPNASGLRVVQCLTGGVEPDDYRTVYAADEGKPRVATTHPVPPVHGANPILVGVVSDGVITLHQSRRRGADDVPPVRFDSRRVYFDHADKTNSSIQNEGHFRPVLFDGRVVSASDPCARESEHWPIRVPPSPSPPETSPAHCTLAALFDWVFWFWQTRIDIRAKPPLISDSELFVAVSPSPSPAYADEIFVQGLDRLQGIFRIDEESINDFQ